MTKERMGDRYKQMAETRAMYKARLVLFTILMTTGRKYTAKQLQEIAQNRLGVCVERKTIFGDMAAIGRIIPIESTTGRYGGYQVVDVIGRCRDGN